MSSVRPGSRFPLPAFLAEIEGPEYRARLKFSVRSGLTLVLAFALWGLLDDTIPKEAIYFWPVILKIVTNTLAWVALARDRRVLLTTSVNVFCDVVAMTWAIYMTGAALSPLFCIYAIELTVVALLSNVGTTILIAVIALAQYVAMILLVHHGVLPQTAPPAASPAELTPSYLLIVVSFYAFVLGIPTFFTAAILHNLRQKQRALEDRTRALVDASKERAQFMANVTHELRTPIHGIRGLSELVSAGVYGKLTDERQLNAHAEIQRSADAMIGLVDDLLELTRSDAGRLSFEAMDVDVNEVCDRLVATTRGLVGRRPLEFVTDIADHLPRVYTDRGKLTQILLNLLANAVKFTPDEGRVRLAVRRGHESVVFEVEDTGRGIPATELIRIFEPFTQVDGTTSREHGGVGLGLTLVKRLSDLLGARVDVASELGRGSTFTVTVPLVPAPAEITGRHRGLVAELA